MVRLFIRIKKLEQNQIIKISDENFDYLIKVMRKKIGDEIAVFNGFDGEFLARIIAVNKKDCEVILEQKAKEQIAASNITLAFAPVKNVRIDFVSAKATEMGVNKFQPIITQHSVVDKINEKRFLANAKEAAEQCERLDVPELNPTLKLNAYLKTLNQNQLLILCDENAATDKKMSVILGNMKINPKQEIVIFIGPEGGFSREEFAAFYQIKNLNSISLGSRILRSDTAIISALAIVQEFTS